MTASSKAQKFAIAGTATLLAEPAMAFAHAGGVGVIAGLMIGGLAYAFSDEITALTNANKEAPEKAASPRVNIDQDKVKSAMYRLMVGKSERGEQVSPVHHKDEQTPDYSKPTKYTFSDVLASGFIPSLHSIYMGKLADGTALYVSAEDLCHVALAGTTGNGKSSLMRLLMAQLCYAGASVLMLNPHYMPYVHDKNEDWTPFIPFLARDPALCAQYHAVEQYLRWLAEDLLPRRIERCRNGGKPGKPYFLVLDELPAIIANVPGAVEYYSRLLREGRKYNIFLIVAAQDFLAKTVAKEEGGAIRKLFRTAEYVGGDSTTAKELLNIAPNSIPENELGKGTIMLRCSVTQGAVRAYVPYVDNESLYQLLGPSTFEAHMHEEDELLSLSPQPAPQNRAQFTGETGESETGEILVKTPEKRGETQDDAGETFTISHEDEIAVLNAAFQVQQSGAVVTREAIKQRLGWNNKRHDVVKFVCDKHMIAMR